MSDSPTLSDYASPVPVLWGASARGYSIRLKEHNIGALASKRLNCTTLQRAILVLILELNNVTNDAHKLANKQKHYR